MQYLPFEMRYTAQIMKKGVEKGLIL